MGMPLLPLRFTVVQYIRPFLPDVLFRGKTLRVQATCENLPISHC